MMKIFYKFKKINVKYIENKNKIIYIKNIRIKNDKRNIY